ncbi:MAG: AAA family ATPase [Thiogranum sp.]|nr:AAA family ATPase [Thiogranum sp.]
MIDAYENYYKYNLSADPFRLSPDHRFAFPHASYAKARAYLEFAIRRGEGFITITGAPGTGKTTLINEIVASIGDSSVLLATLSSTQLESRDLLHMVAAAFGLRYGDVSKATLLLGLEEFLTQQQRKNKRAVLIVDEAQGLSPAAIEELRLLANLQCQNRLLLQVVLVGQEQLRELVKAPGMEHLSQRIIVATYLEPLSLSDTVTYIEHRLKKVRWRGDPAITEDALRLIHRYSGGVPRRINLICSRLFLFGGLEGKQELGGEDAQIVIDDLQKESLLPDTVPEAPGEDAEQSGDLVLSLPREATTGSADAVEAGASPRTGQAAREPEMEQKRSVHGAEVEDILSSRAPLRAALGQVFATLEDTEQADAGLKRRPVERTSAAPRPARKPEPVARDRTRPAAAGMPPAAPAADQAASATRPHSRRNRVALIAVATGLALAFGLTRLDRSDSPSDSVAVTEQPSAAFTMPRNPSAEDVIIRDNDEAESQAIQDDAADVQATPDAVTDAATEEPVMPAPQAEPAPEGEAKPEGDTEPQNTLASVDGNPAGAADTPAPPEEAAEDPDPQSLSPQTSIAEEQPASRSPEPEMSEPAPVAASTPPAAPVAAPAPAAAVVDREVPAAKTATTGSQVGRPSSAEIEAEKARLAEEARARFARQLAQAETQPVPVAVPRSEPVPRAPVPAAPATAPQPSQPKVSPPSPSLPKVAVARPAAPAPEARAESPVDTAGRIKAALLQGQWTSRDQPASLLPSDVTLCKDEQATISCWSVPRNVNTKYGEALYKVEATIKGFSAGGNFEILYRTLVKLVASQGSGDSPAEADKGDWQVSEYTTQCQLTQPDRVSCRDEKGVTREYRR